MIALSVIGFLLQAVGVQRSYEDGGSNVLALSCFEVAGYGCFLVSFIFGIVVTHKVIAMMIYLVHARSR
ncbi:hypothetical protein CQ011_12370 [Arthrobacter sp. MYb213]|nr:hypothetical protein CQ011_12370 [Arthrobacter sp. MYb213]